MSFQIIRNDITKVTADAIVNTANPNPTYGGGVDSAIYEAAGVQQLLAERKKIGPIPRGQAAVTPAFGLNARYIIHTVGPMWVDGNHGEFDTLKQCYENSLALAEKLGCRSIAFPLIATGVYGFPKDRALQIAMSVIQPFLMEHSMKVTLVVFSDSAFRLSGEVVDSVREYVDSNYVAAAEDREYRMDARRMRNLPPDERWYAAIYGRRAEAESMEDEDLPKETTLAAPAHIPAPRAPSAPKAAPGRVDIDSLLASQEKTFQEKLFEIIDSRGLTGPQVYKDYISRQVYSKIQSDRNYHPNKYTAIALCLALHLNIEETQDLIGRAGWTLSPSSKADLVVKGCIMNKVYNLVDIDLLLFDYHCPELVKIK